MEKFCKKFSDIFDNNNNNNNKYPFPPIDGNKLVIGRLKIGQSLATNPNEINVSEKGEKFIYKSMFENPNDGENINGTFVMKVPDFIIDKLGEYYMYFAHHEGKYIRLAYSNSLTGPWKLYTGPHVLSVDDCDASREHVASPFIVIIDKILIMFFHSPLKKESGQKSFYATSSDGLKFQCPNNAKPVLPLPYMTLFKYPTQSDLWFAFGKRGDTCHVLYRSTSGPLGPYQEGPSVLERGRHISLNVVNNNTKLYLNILYSRIQDEPEAIVATGIDISNAQNWKYWVSQDKFVIGVIKPMFDYEGVNLPIKPSEGGESVDAVHQLRDPFIYNLKPNNYILYYSTEGEKGIAAAQLFLI